MSRGFNIAILVAIPVSLSAANEIGPEGHKLLWLAVFFAAAVWAGIFIGRISKGKGRFRFQIPWRKDITVELKKDRLYYPRNLEMIVLNRSDKDVDIDNPVLILRGWWCSRKFKLKGTNNNLIYPLYLMKNQNHTLNIDLQRFYGFDRKLMKLPKAKIVVRDVHGRFLGSRQVLLRKTLF